MELKSIPEHQRTARECILIMAYEKYQSCHQEIQELRMSRDTSRYVLSIVKLYYYKTFGILKEFFCY